MAQSWKRLVGNTIERPIRYHQAALLRQMTHRDRIEAGKHNRYETDEYGVIVGLRSNPVVYAV